jgi:hypothetical protein
MCYGPQAHKKALLPDNFPQSAALNGGIKAFI